MNEILPPGTLLQLMYLQSRLKNVTPGSFIEIGAGQGEITARLLKSGWRGTVWDLEQETIERLAKRFKNEVQAGRLRLEHGDYLNSPGQADADLVISCMVMEHLTEEQENVYVTVSERHLRHNGLMIGIVPAEDKYWGIEDEIAGHYRRYSRTRIKQLFTQHTWNVRHLSGLTFPISNLLLSVSNVLVSRAETSKRALPVIERTKQSGRREVAYKTHFPPAFKWVLNEFTMRPFYWVQNMFSGSNRSMVIYFEAVPAKSVEHE